MNASAPDVSKTKNTRKYTRRSEAQWRELIANFEQSELSLEAYCHHHKIASSGFYTWRKRFERESEKTTSAEAFVDITPQLSTELSSRASSKTSWQVELELSPGCVLRIKTA